MRIMCIAVLLAFFTQAAICNGGESGASAGSAAQKLAKMGIAAGYFDEKGLQPRQGLLRGDAVRLLLHTYNLNTNYPDFTCPPYDASRHHIRFFHPVCLAFSLNIIPDGTLDTFAPEEPISGIDFAVMLLRARAPMSSAAITAETAAGLLAGLPGLKRSEIDAWLAKAPFTQADAADLLYAVHMPEVASRNDTMRNSVTVEAAKENIIKVGQAVRIVLKENQTTPYRWYYRVSDDKAVRLLDDYYRSDPNPQKLCGVGGTHYFYFVVGTPGEYMIELQDNRIGSGFQAGESGLHYRLRVID